MLSAAAGQLQKVRERFTKNAAASERDTLPRRTLTHITSMEHLYRMVFAITMACSGSGQRTLYLKTADQQAKLAQKNMEVEYGSCSTLTGRQASLCRGLAQLIHDLSIALH